MKTRIGKNEMVGILVVCMFAALTFAWSTQAAVMLDQHQDYIQTRTSLGYDSGNGINYKTAESISPTLGMLDKVVFSGDGVTAGTQVTLDVWGTTPGGFPETGTLLGSQTIGLTGNGDFTFDFSSNPIDVSNYRSGTAMIMLALSADTVFNPFIATANYYAGGDRYSQETLAQTWSGPYGSDLYFQEFGHNAVPEPSVIMLIAGGGLVLAMRRRRR